MVLKRCSAPRTATLKAGQTRLANNNTPHRITSSRSCLGRLVPVHLGCGAHSEFEGSKLKEALFFLNLIAETTSLYGLIDG